MSEPVVIREPGPAALVLVVETRDTPPPGVAPLAPVGVEVAPATAPVVQTTAPGSPSDIVTALADESAPASNWSLTSDSLLPTVQGQWPRIAAATDPVLVLDVGTDPVTVSVSPGVRPPP